MNTTRVARSMLLAGAVLAATQGAHASVIYRWVDEQGRTHLADTVPEKYRQSATRVDAGRYELTPAQAQEAQARAAREKALADEAVRRRAAMQAVPPAVQASAPDTSKQATRAEPATGDCATRWRRYHESEACFGPFRTVGGGIKPEAFAKCKPVTRPELQCGPELLR